MTTEIDAKVVAGRTGDGTSVSYQGVPFGVRVYDVTAVVSTITIDELTNVTDEYQGGSGVWLEWVVDQPIYVLAGDPGIPNPDPAARFDTTPDQQCILIPALLPWQRWWGPRVNTAKVVIAGASDAVLRIERVSMIPGRSNQGA